MTDDTQLKKAREIGFDVWKARAVGWRKANGLNVNPDWVESVRRSYMWGAFDKEDGVTAALAGIRAQF